MPGPLATHTYVSDNGTSFNLKQNAGNAASAGNTAAAVGSQVMLPSRTRPRYVLARSTASGRERKIVINSVSNGLWTGATASIALIDYFVNGTDVVAFQIAGRVGEKRFSSL